jgi:gas vesicle protein
MALDRDKLKKAGKAAGLGVVGAGVGALGSQQVDDAPSKEKVQNLQDQKADLEEKVANLEERPTQEDLDNRVADLKEDTVAQKEYLELKNKYEQAYTQEEVDALVADAEEREGLVGYLPVLVDEEVELRNGDVEAKHDVQATDGNLEHHVVADDADFDESDLDNEEYDQIRAVYRHDDGHQYEVLVRAFEDGDDADEYEGELRQAVEFADYDDQIDADADVIRSGDTVLYLKGEADVDDYDTYRYDKLVGQY